MSRSQPAEAARRAHVLARFERVLDRRVAEPDLDAFRARQVIVHQTGDLSLIYRHDELFYLLDGQRLAIEPSGFFPVRVGNRYVLQDGESIVAIERGEVVARHDVRSMIANAAECWRPLHPQAHAEWVNISCQPSGRTVLTYSLASNRFLRVDLPADRGADVRRMRDPLLFVSECG